MSDGTTVLVRPRDFVPAREVVRRFSKIVDDLLAGRRVRVVVVHRNKPTVVIVSLDEYARLSAAYTAIVDQGQGPSREP